MWERARGDGGIRRLKLDGSLAVDEAFGALSIELPASQGKETRDANFFANWG